MKKKTVLILTAILVLVLAVSVFTACNKKSDKDEYSNVSRCVFAFYAGESENYAVTVETGKKEKNFIADGVATAVCDFAEVTVVPLKAHEFTSIDFSLTSDGTALSGTVAADDFGEFKVSLTALEFKPAAVTLTVGENSETLDLQNILEEKLTAEDVINIAEREFADRISEATADGKALNREVYIKLITGDRENYYYYVSFIGDGVDYWALLVNPDTGEIVSKK